MADIILEVTVPNQWTTRVMEAFTTIADTHLTIESRGSQNMPDGSDFDGRWDFRIEPQMVGETAVQFGERVLRELGKAVVNMVDKAEDEVRYRSEISAINPPASDVPNDVLI